MAVPIVDGIDWNTLEHRNIYGKSLKRGIWEWGFLYKEGNVPEKELRDRKSEPYWLFSLLFFFNLNFKRANKIPSNIFPSLKSVLNNSFFLFLKKVSYTCRRIVGY